MITQPFFCILKVNGRNDKGSYLTNKYSYSADLDPYGAIIINDNLLKRKLLWFNNF